MRPLPCSGYDKLTTSSYLAWSARAHRRPCQSCRHATACTGRTIQLTFNQGRRSELACSAHAVVPLSAAGQHSTSPLATVVVVVPEQALSPLGRYEQVTWVEVMQHMAIRLANVNPLFLIEVFTDRISEDSASQLEFLRAVKEADMFIACGITDPAVVSLLNSHTKHFGTALFFESKELEDQTRLDGLKSDSAWQKLWGKLRWTRSARSSKLLATVKELWERNTSDDLLFIFLVLIDAYVFEVDTIKALRAQSLGSILCMGQHCRSQILACLSNPDCKKGLDCLQACGPNDQVCSYRCIASYESKEFEQFSLCILQKHNCLGLNAQIPARPNPLPMTAFRGEPLTHETAEQLFIGWLGNGARSLKWSWRVVGGANAAYDQFPSQFQLYYPGRAKGTLWYDPVFQVRTLDGQRVWRRRHYRVRRRDCPGTFSFSVLDNGVTSNEFWRIMDVPDDLSWALFFYSGAAAVVGQSYTGAVLCTPDGQWPSSEHESRIKAALGRADIKTWELFRVDNSDSDGAPLDIPEKDIKMPAGLL